MAPCRTAGVIRRDRSNPKERGSVSSVPSNSTHSASSADAVCVRATTTAEANLINGSSANQTKCSTSQAQTS
jgi:hypothetical protein